MPPTLILDDEVPRFHGRQAPLAALAAQVRNASEPEDKASAAGRLARQLVHRDIELREAIALAEKSLTLHSDPELGCELAAWWASAGDAIRGAALLQTHSEELSDDRRKTALLEVALIYAHSGHARKAHQVLRRVMELAPGEPKPFELLGSLGFWSDIAENECARAYLKAAEFRLAAGEEAAAFENRLRAFEVDPTLPEAATKLASALRKRGRSGAADEILREHLRRGSAAHRAAHHQRVFYGAFSEGDLPRALESAFEAELDIELDPDRLSSLLSGDAQAGVDFESFLVYLAKDGELGDARLFGQWLLALVDVHRRTWGSRRTEQLSQLVTQTCGVEPLPELADPTNERRCRELRRRLGTEVTFEEWSELREEIARRECSLDHWEDAYEVFEPLLAESQLSLTNSVLGIVIAGRARKPVARARALSAFGACLPGAASAVAHAVAAEGLLAHGLVDEARAAARAAVEADPTSERALASQALVALSAPEDASAGLLERSLSVLVARSDACAVLCRSASRRGSERLGLTWAARGLALRPGDRLVASRYLRQAILAKDPEQLSSAILEVLDRPLPLQELSADLARAISALTDLSQDHLPKVGSKILAVSGIRFDDVVDALIEAAKKAVHPELLAAITERQLVVSSNSERAGLSLLLCRQRLRADQPVPAARALRRALAQGADWVLIQEALSDFDDRLEPDGVLSLMEIRADRMPQDNREQCLEKSRALLRVGAARWDMAQDSAGAIQLWLRAADLQPDRGLDLFAHYLRTIAGAQTAAKQLKLAARQTEDPKRSGKLLGLASVELLRLDQKTEAFALAREALKRAPLLSELLTVIEQSSHQDQSAEMERLFTHLAAHSMGTYGERAVHYRAARYFEQCGMLEKAFEHARLAFEAAPAEGVAFVLMARLADSVAGHPALVESLQKAADGAATDDERARWLERAAALADTETMGRRQRTEILFRAATMRPEASTIESMQDALAHLLADEPDLRDELWAHYTQVSREILRDAAGAHGAQLAVLLGKAGTTHFEQPDFTLACLKEAIAFDIEVPEYADLVPLSNQLAGLVEKSEELIDQVRTLIEASGAPLGKGLASLAGRIAELLGDNESQTEFLVRAASDSPEDAELVAWARKAATRDNRQDLLGLIEGFLPAGDRAELVLGRLGALSADEGLDALLDLDIDTAPEPLRARLLEALAERQEQVGRTDDAGRSYRDLLVLVPDHLDALRGVERDAERSGDFEELCEILQKRVELSPDEGEVRRLKLRRAVILETRLSRAGEARDLLTEMLAEGEDRAALRMLADSWQRSGDYTQAAELWERVRRVAQDDEEADDAAFRAAFCFVESGTPRRAAESLSEIKRPTREHRQLGLEVARQLKDKAAILDHLIGLAEVTVGDHQEAGRLFLEAARLCLKAQDFRRAERCAWRANEMIPHSPEGRFLLARMRARRTLPTDQESARDLKEQLAGTEEVGGATEREIHAFLSAQVLRFLESREAARQLLERAIEEQGTKPLLALGLAELMRDDPEQAVSLYEHAVGGDLYGFRGEGEILLEAGHLARELGDYDRARGLVSAIPEDDPLRGRAAQELEEIALDEARVEREAREEEEAREREEAEARKAREREEAEREEEEAQKAPEHTEQPDPRQTEATGQKDADRKDADRKDADRKDAEPEDGEPDTQEAQTTVSDAEDGQKGVDQSEEGADESEDGADESEDGAEDVESSRAAEAEAIRAAAREEHRRATQAAREREESTGEVPSSVPIGSLKQHRLPTLDIGDFEEDPIPPVPIPAMSSSAVSSSAVGRRPSIPSRHPPQTERSDEELVAQLEGGDIDSGLELLERLQAHRSRSRDAMVVAQHLAALDPGDASLLGRLVTTAARDGNDALALAVRHVLGAYGSGDPVRAPAAENLVVESEAALALLKHACLPAHEALGLVWEHSHGLYRRELAQYGISGIERVPLNAPTTLGTMYGAAARLLSRGRTPVFRSDAHNEISMQIALLVPPAVIIAGDIEESSAELNYHFGAMLAATFPEHALLFGCSPEEIGHLLEALSLSFGAGHTGRGQRPSPEVTRVASFFWETIPPRAQRRLSQLCSEPADLNWSKLMVASRRVLRRAGLIVCGDLPTAIADACLEMGQDPPRQLSELSECASRNPAVSDLLGLALSPEYAELRFREGR